MCVRYTRRKNIEEIPSLFNASSDIKKLPPSYNVSPGDPILSIIQNEDKRMLTTFQWGLIPHWAKDPGAMREMFNARGETINEKNSFKTAFAKHRCLIIADGFYEWKKENPDSNDIGTSKGNLKKIPHFVHMKDDSIFAFAGIFDIWHPNRSGYENVVKQTCAIITIEPNQLIAPIHDRMPVILSPDDYDTWLDPSVEDEDLLLSLLKPYPADEMEAYEVSKYVNSTRNNSPKCIEPVS